MNRFFRYLQFASALLLLFSATEIGAQTTSNLKKAIDLHHSYDFVGAHTLLKAAKSTADSSQLLEIEDLLMQCDNGSNMLHYACSPTVVTSKTVAAKDFYLWFSQLKNRSWMSNPNAFTGEEGHKFCTATYFDKSKKDIYFSKPDENGRWNIYKSTLQGDTLWSIPATLSNPMVSSGDEIFPILSTDGKKLYFSSNGMAGMGGYDIYVSELCADGISWSAPENLGFPFSSPYDDFLYFDTPDGKFTMFASNRDCPKDSIIIYVLAYEHNTVRRSISSVQEAREIAALKPKKSAVTPKQETVEPSANAEFKEWFEALDRLTQVKDSIAFLEEDMKELRSSYAQATEEQRGSLQLQILEGEVAQMELQRRMSSVTANVRTVEAAYLAKGVTPPFAVQAQPEMPTTPELQYAFAKNSFGTMPSVRIAEPEPEFDYTFTIGKEAVIVDSLPDGIIYQAQLCLVVSKLPLKKLRGMSPVFEVKQKTGKYIYYAGAFKTYEEATEALPQIKKCGFSGAYIVAFKDGKSISVKNARAQEK